MALMAQDKKVRRGRLTFICWGRSAARSSFPTSSLRRVRRFSECQTGPQTEQ